MLAEIIIENEEIRVINFPKGMLRGRHWKVNIEPIEEIQDEYDQDFISEITQTPVHVADDFSFFSRDAANER